MTDIGAPAAIVLMGVSGSGKTTVGASLAAKLGAAFLEGDSLHPPQNIAKMRAGIPLTDADRAPWLNVLAARIEDERKAGQGVVAACSALKHSYRDWLRAGVQGSILFVLLESPRTLLEARLRDRAGHFMPAGLLDSQLATLEPPAPGENILLLSGELPVADLVAAITARVVRPDASPAGNR